MNGPAVNERLIGDTRAWQGDRTRYWYHTMLNFHMAAAGTMTKRAVQTKRLVGFSIYLANIQDAPTVMGFTGIYRLPVYLEVTHDLHRLSWWMPARPENEHCRQVLKCRPHEIPPPEATARAQAEPEALPIC